MALTWRLFRHQSLHQRCPRPCARLPALPCLLPQLHNCQLPQVIFVILLSLPLVSGVRRHAQVRENVSSQWCRAEFSILKSSSLVSVKAHEHEPLRDLRGRTRGKMSITRLRHQPHEAARAVWCPHGNARSCTTVAVRHTPQHGDARTAASSYYGRRDNTALVAFVVGTL